MRTRHPQQRRALPSPRLPHDHHQLPVRTPGPNSPLLLTGKPRITLSELAAQGTDLAVDDTIVDRANAPVRDHTGPHQHLTLEPTMRPRRLTAISQLEHLATLTQPIKGRQPTLDPRLPRDLQRDRPRLPRRKRRIELRQTTKHLAREIPLSDLVTVP